MPGTITHNYILFKALSTYPADDNSLIGKIKQSQRALYADAQSRVMNKSDFEFTIEEGVQASVTNQRGPKALKIQQHALTGCAYLGCCGPDLFYLETGSKGVFIADLMHYNRSGLYMIWWLNQLKDTLRQFLELDTPDDKSLREFAFCLGHISHIAADITIHPYVNSIVSAYPDNEQVFLNSRGYNRVKPKWKFHNILEHHQDAYVLYNLFFGGGGLFGDAEKNWENANMGRWAAHYLKVNSEYFFVKRSSDFYSYAKTYDSTLENDKLKFFLSDNIVMNLDYYYDTTIPNIEKMKERTALVQATLLEKYIDKAVAKTHQMWGEAERYLSAKSVKGEYSDPELKTAKSYFPILRKHWNLDTGLAPGGDNSGESWDVKEKEHTKFIAAGSLKFESSNTGSMTDIDNTLRAL
jgi:hypothetical protein